MANKNKKVAHETKPDVLGEPWPLHGGYYDCGPGDDLAVGATWANDRAVYQKQVAGDKTFWMQVESLT